MDLWVSEASSEYSRENQNDELLVVKIRLIFLQKFLAFSTYVFLVTCLHEMNRWHCSSRLVCRKNAIAYDCLACTFDRRNDVNRNCKWLKLINKRWAVSNGGKRWKMCLYPLVQILLENSLSLRQDTLANLKSSQKTKRYHIDLLSKK